MSEDHTKSTRKEILNILYTQYLRDPMKMLTPDDMLGDTLDRERLAPNVHYLHERGFVELLVGYNAPLFAAVRIAPDGIDLIEDAHRFTQMFSSQGAVTDAVSSETPALVLAIADEVEASSLTNVRKEWLLADLRELRDQLRRPAHERQEIRVSEILQSLDEYFDDDASMYLPSLARLKSALEVGE